jgi:hypothetical protein
MISKVTNLDKRNCIPGMCSGFFVLREIQASSGVNPTSYLRDMEG